jgi:hypothetical protein
LSVENSLSHPRYYVTSSSARSFDDQALCEFSQTFFGKLGSDRMIAQILAEFWNALSKTPAFDRGALYRSQIAAILQIAARSPPSDTRPTSISECALTPGARQYE